MVLLCWLISPFRQHNPSCHAKPKHWRFQTFPFPQVLFVLRGRIELPATRLRIVDSTTELPEHYCL